MAGLPVFYSFRRCPYAMRARLALAVSGTAVELREVVLRDKPPSLIGASPKGTVPVLLLADGTVLAESLCIMQWALAQHDPCDWLRAGAAPGDTAALVEACDRPFKQALDRCKYPGKSAPQAVQTSWLVAQAWLETLELRLAQHSALCADKNSLADAAIFPFVRQFAAIDPARWAAMPLPRMRAWLGGWLNSALFASTMDKYPPWEPNAAPLKVYGD